MRTLLAAAAGFVMGVWLAFAAVSSPAARPDGAALRVAGQSARLDPSEPAFLSGPVDAGAGAPETIVPLEEVRGVWIVTVLLNGAHAARFLLDTGSSVTLISPRIAAKLPGGLPAQDRVELQTLSGLTTGPAGRLASLRIGDVHLQDVPVVLHDPGPGIDGILGNTVLSHYRLTLDSPGKRLHLTAAR